MFDLIFVLSLFVAALFGGALVSIILSRTSARHTSSNRKMMNLAGIVAGSIAGTCTMLVVAGFGVVSGEPFLLTRLFLAFIEGFAPATAGLLIGFAATGSSLK